MTALNERDSALTRRTKPARPGQSRRPHGSLLLFLFPAVALVGVLLILPFLFTIYRSFFRDNGFSRSWVGLENYTTLLTDDIFVRSVLNTGMWTAGTLLLPVLLGLLIAVGTNSVRWGPIARFAIVLPYALSGAVTALLWNFMLQTDGATNALLSALGLSALERPWLLEWPMNTIVMIIATTWQATGASMILFLVGLQAIPAETIEAGRVDGAGGFRLFRSIVLPQLRPISVVVVGISLVNSLKTFDIVWLLTRGGPGTSSETLALTMYRQTFTLSRYGYGAAVAVILTVIVLVASWTYLRRQLRAN
ncbi:carbohydrate ABC transporter permease [Phytoactinopolyspora endophytica]|uniref:carbohydrate ABC transporter permease n=1 Tax=Phytoactinopolyspora endophytica TaxID=1642495 RepID=UPI00197C8131|nr:sugar ABC transporter permease [Phytoactinopolyspora endophytica]